MNLQKAAESVSFSEGLKLEAYQDDKGIWTIAFGTTIYPDGSRVKQGDTCTKEQALEWLNLHLQDTAQRVLDLCYPIVLGENQLNALVSLVYNIGIGNFRGSTLLKEIHLPDFSHEPGFAASQFLVWDKERINGELVESNGLKARREREKALFLS